MYLTIKRYKQFVDNPGARNSKQELKKKIKTKVFLRAVLEKN